jgi:outer membrane biosynthesis protein TonB
MTPIRGRFILRTLRRSTHVVSIFCHLSHPPALCSATCMPSGSDSLAHKVRLPPDKVMSKTRVVFVAVLLAACGGDEAELRRDQQDYEVVQEGAGGPVTSTVGAPGEVMPPLTGTNADTTSAFTLPTATGTTTTFDSTPGGSLADTLPRDPVPTTPRRTSPTPRPAPTPTPAPTPVPEPQPAEAPREDPQPTPQPVEEPEEEQRPPVEEPPPPPPPPTTTTSSTTDTSTP